MFLFAKSMHVYENQEITKKILIHDYSPVFDGCFCLSAALRKEKLFFIILVISYDIKMYKINCNFMKYFHNIVK